MIFTCGDTHCDYDIGKLTTDMFPVGQVLTKQDYVIILGDFGMFFHDPIDETAQYWLDWLESKPWTTLFFPGNHDNPLMIKALPDTQMFGGKVGIAGKSIFCLRNGEVYEIEGKKFFVFGGAMSTDKWHRTEGKSWWSEEIPSKEEQEYGLAKLREHNCKVDYILTHTAPRRIIEEHIVPIKPSYAPRLEDPLAYYFDLIEDTTEFAHWHFGHFHMDKTFEDKFHLQYHHLIELEHENV